MVFKDYLTLSNVLWAVGITTTLAHCSYALNSTSVTNTKPQRELIQIDHPGVGGVSVKPQFSTYGNLPSHGNLIQILYDDGGKCKVWDQMGDYRFTQADLSVGSCPSTLDLNAILAKTGLKVASYKN